MSLYQRLLVDCTIVFQQKVADDPNFVYVGLKLNKMCAITAYFFRFT